MPVISGIIRSVSSTSKGCARSMSSAERADGVPVVV